MLKTIISLICMLSVSVSLWAQQITTRIEPNPLKVGDQGNYVITIQGNAQLRSIDLPEVKGITWHRNMNQSGYSVVNGVTSATQTLVFTVSQEGSYTVPPLNLTFANGATEKTKSMTFTVKNKDWGVKNKDGLPMTISQLFYGKTAVASVQADGKPRTTFYVGELIPLQTKYYAHVTLNAEPQYPQFSEHPDLVITKIPDQQTGEPRDFGFVGQTVEQVGDNTYKVFNFISYFRPMKAGTYNGLKVTGHGNLLERRRARDPMDIYFGHNAMTRKPYAFETLIPSITIENLPPLPRDVLDLGLIGEYKIEFELSKAPYKVGECFTLDVMVSQGNVDGIKPPKLSADGFRIYPPETTELKNGNQRSMRIRYVILPMVEGSHSLQFNFVYFSPKHKDYLQRAFNETITVEHNPLASLNSGATVESFDHPSTTEAQSVKHLSDILYLKPVAKTGIVLPLTQNAPLNIFALIALGFVGYLAGLILAWRRHHSKNGPDDLRYQAALKKRKILIDKLKNADNPTFDELARTDFMDWLCDMTRSHAGSSASELSEKIKNKELNHALKEIEMATYHPDGLTQNRESIRATLLTTLKKLSFIFLFALMLPLFAQKTDSAFDERSAYDAGRFQEALSGYQSQATTFGKEIHPELLYNLGNCYFQLQKYPEALVMFERAHRLSPNDADILSNLNATCRKLEISERGRVKSPMDLFRAFRDTFRLDSWWMGIGIFGCLMLLCVGANVYSRLTVFKHLMVWSFVACVLSMGMYFWQKYDFFERNDAIILQDATPVWNLSVAENAKQLATLVKGETVEIREERPNTYLIRVKDIEGWVAREHLSEIWDDAIYQP